MKGIVRRKKKGPLPAPAPRKGERLETRVSPEAKALCQRAADLQGRTLTDFVIQSAVEAAIRTIRETELLELTRRDRLAFVEAVLNAPAPNARLQQAMRRHNELVGR
jgi:uncharacterized protein (DUF1778 family)